MKWRSAAVAEAIGNKRPITTAEPDRSVNLFSGALVDTLGSLKMTVDTLNLKDAADAEGSKHFTRLPQHLKTLLFRISYVPGTEEPTALTNEGGLFMKQHSLSNATSLLKTALHQKYGLSVVVQPASVQAVRTGQLLWDDPTTPGNHSVFQYYSQTASDCEDLATELAWHLTSTKDRGLKGSEIKKALKLSPWVAGSVFGCLRQILNFGSTHGHLYGNDCPIHNALRSFSTWILSAAAIVVMERLTTKYSRFYERLLATLDISVQAYIASCADAGQADEIEGTLLNFDDGIK
jgi:hypothetical protein